MLKVENLETGKSEAEAKQPNENGLEQDVNGKYDQESGIEMNM